MKLDSMPALPLLSFFLFLGDAQLAHIVPAAAVQDRSSGQNEGVDLSKSQLGHVFAEVDKSRGKGH